MGEKIAELRDWAAERTVPARLMGTFLISLANGDGLRAWRSRLPRVDPLCSLKVARASGKEMGTFLISPLGGQKGTDLLQVCPLLLGK